MSFSSPWARAEGSHEVVDRDRPPRPLHWAEKPKCPDRNAYKRSIVANPTFSTTRTVDFREESDTVMSRRTYVPAPAPRRTTRSFSVSAALIVLRLGAGDFNGVTNHYATLGAKTGRASQDDVGVGRLPPQEPV
jgi:hypothetical protein